MNEIKPISFLSSVLLFLIPGFIFYAVIGYVVPFVSDITGMTNYLVWLFAGTLLLFGPLFVLTLLLLKKDGFELNLPTIRQRLLLKRISLKDILWVMAGIVYKRKNTSLAILVHFLLGAPTQLFVALGIIV